MNPIDDYLKHVSPTQKTVLTHIRELAKSLVPEPEEKISYGVPTIAYRGKYVIYFAAYKNHMSVYPVSESLAEELGEALTKFRTSKGTLQFTEANPIPDAIIKKMVVHRLEELGVESK